MRGIFLAVFRRVPYIFLIFTKELGEKVRSLLFWQVKTDWQCSLWNIDSEVFDYETLLFNSLHIAGGTEERY